MQHAPSVVYPTGRCAFWAACWSATWGLGVVLIGALVWARMAAQHNALTLGWLALPLLSAVWAGRDWQRQQPGTLDWDGQLWTWQAAAADDGTEAQPVRLGARHALGGGHLLLELIPQTESGRTASRWVCACAQADAPHWLALRRAVYSRADAA